MGIDEYDAELHEKTLIDIGYERGIDIGREQGIDIGITKTITTTISFLKENGFSDSKISEALVSKFGLTPEESKKYITEI